MPNKPSSVTAHLQERMRLDKWLWAARFFKTRHLAVEAINGGKVHVNGQRAKPGKEIECGQKITLTKDIFTFDITVSALNGQRRPAGEAATLYLESEESIDRRKALLHQKREDKEMGIEPQGRPSKRDRRLIHRFKGTGI